MTHANLTLRASVLLAPKTSQNENYSAWSHNLGSAWWFAKEAFSQFPGQVNAFVHESFVAFPNSLPLFVAIRCQEQVTDWLLLVCSSQKNGEWGRLVTARSIANEKYDFV